MHPLQIFCKSQALSETYDYGFITLITLENVRKNICCQRNQSFNFFNLTFFSNFNLTSVFFCFVLFFLIKVLHKTEKIGAVNISSLLPHISDHRNIAILRKALCFCEPLTLSQLHDSACLFDPEGDTVL